MELRTQEFQLPEEPQFNFDELKSWLSERTEEYKTTVYTDSDIGKAKEDRANLNRLKKALNDRRIQIEKDYMRPFNEFKSKINELIALIDEPAKLIDQRVKEYEQAKKDEKAGKIGEMFDAFEGRPEWLQLGQIWEQKWLNASVSMKKVNEELAAKIEGVNSDLQTLATIQDFGYEATEEYKRTLDINKALAEGMRLAEIQKRKEAEEKARAEEEARRAEAERQAKLDSILHNPTSQIINAAEAREEAERQGIAYMNPPELEPMHEITEPFPGGPVEQMEMPSWVRFEALMTTPQARALKSFCKANGIEIRPF